MSRETANVCCPFDILLCVCLYSFLFPVKMLPQIEFWCGLSVLSFSTVIFFFLKEVCITGNPISNLLRWRFLLLQILFVFSVHKVNKSTLEYVIEKMLQVYLINS